MLIVAGTFLVDPDRRDEFIAARHDGMRHSRAEPGCIEYSFCADPLEPGKVILYERWASKADLAAHLAALKERPPAADTVPVHHREVLQYEISAEGPVGS